MEPKRRRTDRKTGKARRRQRVICLVLIALCAYFIYAIIALRANLSKEQQDLDALTAQVAEQELLNEELERIVYSDGEWDYVERVAREKLGYAAIDERVFVDLAGAGS